METPAPDPIETPVTTPAETTEPGDETTEPGDEATEPGDETGGEDPAPPAGDFPFEEGPVDVDEFTAMYTAAMEGVDHLLQTTEGAGADSVTFVDMSDPDNPRAYGTSEVEGTTIETVVADGVIWSREGEDGEWQQVGEMPSDEDLAGIQAEFESVELVDQAARQFSVEIPAMEGTQTALLTVDEQFRASVMEIEIMDQTVITSFDYETTMEIPEVG